MRCITHKHVNSSPSTKHRFSQTHNIIPLQLSTNDPSIGMINGPSCRLLVDSNLYLLSKTVGENSATQRRQMLKQTLSFHTFISFIKNYTNLFLLLPFVLVKISCKQIVQKNTCFCPRTVKCKDSKFGYLLISQNYFFDKFLFCS